MNHSICTNHKLGGGLYIFWGTAPKSDTEKGFNDTFSTVLSDNKALILQFTNCVYFSLIAS